MPSHSVPGEVGGTLTMKSVSNYKWNTQWSLPNLNVRLVLVRFFPRSPLDSVEPHYMIRCQTGVLGNAGVQVNVLRWSETWTWIYGWKHNQRQDFISAQNSLWLICNIFKWLKFKITTSQHTNTMNWRIKSSLRCLMYLHTLTLLAECLWSWVSVSWWFRVSCIVIADSSDRYHCPESRVVLDMFLMWYCDKMLGNDGATSAHLEMYGISGFTLENVPSCGFPRIVACVSV